MAGLFVRVKADLEKGENMTLTLLNLYNAAATQEGSMYDNDAASGSEFENSLVLALNKALQEILYSYPFAFRERTHIVLTLPNIKAYDLPVGIIRKNAVGKYCVKLGTKFLDLIEKPDLLGDSTGIPEGFFIKNNKIYFYPTPEAQSIITIEYTTLCVGENKSGDEIFALKNDDDIVDVPPHLEELLKNAVISRAMLNSIASESDENYSAYKKQSETAYRLLIKYAKGVDGEKRVRL